MLRKKNNKNENFEMDTSFRAGEGTAGYLISIKSDKTFFQSPNETFLNLINSKSSYRFDNSFSPFPIS